MLKEQAKLLNRLTITFDLSLVVISFVVAYYVRSLYLSADIAGIYRYSWILLPALPVWYYLLAKYNLYKSIRQISFLDLAYRIFCVHFFSGFVISALILFFDRDFYSRKLVLAFIATAFILILLERVLLKALLSFIRRRGLNYRQLLIVGTTERAQEFIKLVEDHADWGLRVLGVLQVASGSLKKNVSGHKVLGRLEDILETCKCNPVDEVVFCLSQDQFVDIEEHLRSLEELGITVRMVLDFYNVDRYQKGFKFFSGFSANINFSCEKPRCTTAFPEENCRYIGLTPWFDFLILGFPISCSGD